MDVLNKYMPLNEAEKSKFYKSFVNRIKKAKSTKEITNLLKDIEKAMKTKSIPEKEMLELVNMADEKLEKF